MTDKKAYALGLNDVFRKRFINKVTLSKDGEVRICWLPFDFSQSRLGDRFTGSNACTLIALLVSLKCYNEDLKIGDLTQTPYENIVRILAESIVEGNDIHTKLMKTGALRHVNMTVPEAITAIGHKIRFITEWKSLTFLMDMRETLFEELNNILKDWDNNVPARCGSDLFVILICEYRTVLIIFQKELDMITLIDSHLHLPFGAVISQVTSKDLESLCLWYHSIVAKYTRSNPECYEISFLYFKRFASGEMEER